MTTPSPRDSASRCLGLVTLAGLLAVLAVMAYHLVVERPVPTADRNAAIRGVA
ncbi:hypothetical protein WCE41_10060 [Luteimonas sp. MJ246]|uniref:hypothetical protein n=1 Tax=Luteimonas sp. MJ174 TaxID=3129237 RepID=UPI0031BA908A